MAQRLLARTNKTMPTIKTKGTPIITMSSSGIPGIMVDNSLGKERVLRF